MRCIVSKKTRLLLITYFFIAFLSLCIWFVLLAIVYESFLFLGLSYVLSLITDQDRPYYIRFHGRALTLLNLLFASCLRNILAFRMCLYCLLIDYGRL